MIIEMKTLNEYFDLSSDGLFSAFNNPIWVNSFQDASELDLYLYMRYGDRIGNKFLDKFIDSDGEVKGENLIKLANLIYSINAKKWEHLYNAYTAEYNPIENTDFIETITETNGNTRVVDTDSSNTRVLDSEGTSSGTASTTSSATSNGSNSGANNKFGFNSSTAVGDTTSSGTDSNTTTSTTTTTSSGSTTEDSTTTDTGTEDTTITDNGNHTSEHRKHGNIGVTENVTMLEHEVEFWKWSFIDSICKDICDVIALSIY